MKRGILFGIVLMVFAWPMGLFGDVSEADMAVNDMLDKYTAVYGRPTEETEVPGKMLTYSYSLRLKGAVEADYSQKPALVMLNTFIGYANEGTQVEIYRNDGWFSEKVIATIPVKLGEKLIKDEIEGWFENAKVDVQVKIERVDFNIRVKESGTFKNEYVAEPVLKISIEAAP